MTFYPPPKVGLLLARRSQGIKNDKKEKEKGIPKDTQDEVFPIIADTNTPVVSAIFQAELATTITTKGIMIQLRQGIIVPNVSCNNETSEVLTTEQVNINKEMRKHVYQYTKAQETIINDQELSTKIT